MQGFFLDFRAVPPLRITVQRIDKNLRLHARCRIDRSQSGAMYCCRLIWRNLAGSPRLQSDTQNRFDVFSARISWHQNDAQRGMSNPAQEATLRWCMSRHTTCDLFQAEIETSPGRARIARSPGDTAPRIKRSLLPAAKFRKHFKYRPGFRLWQCRRGTVFARMKPDCAGTDTQGRMGVKIFQLPATGSVP